MVKENTPLWMFPMKFSKVFFISISRKTSGRLRWKHNFQNSYSTYVKLIDLLEHYWEVKSKREFKGVFFSIFRCPHCRSLEPVWDKLATRYKHDKRITIAKVHFKGTLMQIGNSLYGLVDIKITLWKFIILNPKNSRVFYP